MTIELNDLYLYPLNSEELSLWLNNLSLLEKNLGCKYCAEPLKGLFRDVVQSQLILGLSELPENWNWYTNWFLIRKSDKKIIGLLFFKGKPNEKQEVEIGYGLGKEFENQGYMTKALSGICIWANNQPGVKQIIAETKIDNYKSQKLLRRCGFEPFKQSETSICFSL